MDGVFQCLLIAGPQRAYNLEASSDLRAWDPIRTITPPQPVVELCDTNSPAFSARYYRVRQTGN